MTSINRTGKEFGDSETPIFWMRPDGSETYQVIYADCHVEKDVPRERLPDIPE